VDLHKQTHTHTHKQELEAQDVFHRSELDRRSSELENMHEGLLQVEKKRHLAALAEKDAEVSTHACLNVHVYACMRGMHVWWLLHACSKQQRCLH
jgi:hypothetical protein